MVRRRRTAAFGWAIIVLVLVAIVFVGCEVAEANDPAETDPAPAIATGPSNGRSVALVTYRTQTEWSLDPARFWSTGYSNQAELFDLDTGERIWDTLLQAEWISTPSVPLAVGDRYAYVATGDGLVILDARTGHIVAQGSEIPGLGDEFIASVSAYAWEEDTRQVIALTAHGEVLAIPVDTAEAQPAAPTVTAHWARELNLVDDSEFDFSLKDWCCTKDIIVMPTGDEIEPSWGPAGTTLDVLVQPSTGIPFGIADGFVVTETWSSGNDHAFEVADPLTGTLLGSIPSTIDASTVVDDGAGHIVFFGRNENNQGLIVIGSEDGIRSSIIGVRGLMGS